MGQATIQAWYEPSPVLEYFGNPLIEAMPPILSEEQAAERLAEFPPLAADERSLPKEVRLHCINRLAHLVQPLPIHLELEAVVSSVFRGGYVGRNPMESGTWRHLHALAARNSSVSTFNSTASTFSLVGLSGMGKTTALKSILNQYPQVIKHTRYLGRDFIHTQIVWLKLECPFDGSLVGLCSAFFRAVDAALGDDSHARYYTSRRSISDLIRGMEQVASTYFVGALFIDELQHLKNAKGSNRSNMLNFFVNLINSIGVPVVFVGTNSMVTLFSDLLRNARRVSGLGLYDFKQPSEDDEAWNLLLEAMWDYQWVRQPMPLTENLRRQIYDLTQGVTDFLAKLMMLGQKHAIQSGTERLDERVFAHVSATKLKLLQPALAALRSKDPEQMSRFDDLLPADAQLEAMMGDDPNLQSDRISVLRRQQDRLYGISEDDVLVATPVIKELSEAGISDTNYPEKGVAAMAKTNTIYQRPVPLSAQYAGQLNGLDLLKGAGWILVDPFEFEQLYQAA